MTMLTVGSAHDELRAERYKQLTQQPKRAERMAELITVELNEQEARGALKVAEFADERLSERKSLPAGWRLQDYQDVVAALKVLGGQVAAGLNKFAADKKAAEKAAATAPKK